MNNGQKIVERLEFACVDGAAELGEFLVENKALFMKHESRATVADAIEALEAAADALSNAYRKLSDSGVRTPGMR